LEQFVAGDPKKARDKDPKKDVSFRKLARRKDLKVSFSWLHKMVAVTVQDNLFEQKGIDATSVSYSIKVELLSLPDEGKITLIQEAVSGHMSVRNVRREVQKVKASSEDKKTIKSSKLVRYLPKLVKIMEGLNPWEDNIAVSLQTLDFQGMAELSDQVIQGQNLLKDLDNMFSTLMQALKDSMKSASIRDASCVSTSAQKAPGDGTETGEVSLGR